MNINLKAENKTQEYLLAYLEANASESLAERINAGKKTLAGAFSYMTDWAKKELRKKGESCVGCPDEVAFGQLIHYFEEDSLDFENKEPVAKVAVAPETPTVKAKGKAKVAVQPAESLDLDSMLAECGIEVAGEEKKPEPKPTPEPEPEAPPAPEERKEPQRMDWLEAFGISI